MEKITETKIDATIAEIEKKIKELSDELEYYKSVRELIWAHNSKAHEEEMNKWLNAQSKKEE